MRKNSNKGYKLSSEKGSVTVYVLAAMMLICIVFIVIYLNVSNRNINQAKDVEKIRQEYDNSANIDEEYNKVVNSISNGTN